MNPLGWRRWFPLATAAAALALACGAPSKTDCNDGFDNDSDGLIDGADPGCELNGDLEAPDPVFPQCSDGEDNDGDSLVDFPEDPGCNTEDDDDEFNEPLPAQCADGMDNDGDQRTDYPNDPGCASMLEDDETDDCPDGPACPACSNGDDDDGDELADYPTDPGCGSAGDADEFNTIPGVCGPTLDVVPLGVLGPGGLMATGQHLGGVPNELQSPGCSGLGGETVYAITLTDPASLYITTDFPETTLDTVIYLRGDCRNPDTELGCNDDKPGKQKVSELLLPSVAAGSYFVVVDAFGPGSLGDFKLQLLTYKGEGEECDPAVMPPECPPGLVCRLELPGSPTETCVEEECADGNDNDGDALNDYPNDPGCTGLTDNAETDTCPMGASCPLCGNDTDDDGDLLIDYPDDPGCTSASDNVEIDECIPGVEVLDLDPEAGATGTTSGASMFAGGCSSSTSSPEKIHAFRLTQPLVTLTFDTTASSFDTVTYVRLDDCGSAAAEVGCADPGAGGDVVNIASPALGTYFVFVDGNFAMGAYNLQVRGTIAPGLACDPASSAFRCTDGYLCSTSSLTCVTTLCNDGMDNDGDTKTDAFDPGCASLLDNSEDPDPSPLPQCANGGDDDADTLIDYPADLGCSRAADDLELDCMDSDPVLELTADPTTGTTVGKTHDFVPSCVLSSTAPEVVYTLPIPGALTALSLDTFGSGYDTVLYMKAGGCDAATSVACDDDDGTLQSRICTSPCTTTAQIPAPVAAGTYFIFVDGFSTASGAYTLNISGTIAAGADCDPAQIAAGMFACAAGTCMDVGGGVMKCM